MISQSLRLGARGRSEGRNEWSMKLSEENDALLDTSCVSMFLTVCEMRKVFVSLSFGTDASPSAWEARRW